MIESILVTVFANQWLVVLMTSALFLGLGEAGHRFGLLRFRAKDEATKGQIRPIQGAVLGLLGLLLGFTFAMAVQRFDARRNLLLQEANAIETTYLRASFLPEQNKKKVENLLRHYVDARIDFHLAGTDAAKIAKAEKTTTAIQRELWAEAVAAGREAPTVLTPTFIAALNETIDLDAARMYAFHSHVPGSVWALLLVVAGVGCYATGYGAGISGSRSAFSGVMFPLLIAVVITLVADLDRPRHGLIRINPQPLLDLRESIIPALETPPSKP